MDWRRRSVLLFLAVCFLLRNQAAAGDNTWDLTEEEDSELERELKTLNKPYVKSFKDEYGITYDCVDIYKQPAFDHPLLKNHTLQFPKRSDNTNKVSIIKQTLPKLCPTGTYAGVEFAAGQGPKYYGASANLDVFQLSGVSHNQQSETQIVLSKGAGGPKNYIDTVQAGWLQGDDRAHFYTYWTSDGYQKTGCFNLDCPGFVQTSTRITPGMVYTLSTLSLTIYRVG
ncbi:hypothetical protein MUK42_11789 [Musa troglodytarum]|uniref:Neprosin PEP catalytic domain-containing protein n=1 Tax=Musa troglodytarum TaxID=320322 RepID=A0A9E7KJ47_9LILI|nr:hypothetical protein MUK42_11789 [Musa troglodytarum]